MRIAILALEGSVLSAVAGMTDLFWITNKAIASSPVHAARFPDKAFETLIVSANGDPVWDTEGRLIHIDSSFQGAGAVDVVIAPGMLLGPDLQPINLNSIRQAAGWFNKLYQQGVWVAAAGTGGVILGEAGLLNDRSFTTTWWVSHMLQARYPQARLAKGKTLEEDDRVITSGGCFSWISLALYIIEKSAGKAVADLTREMSLADNPVLHTHLPGSPGAGKSSTPFLVRAQEIIRLENPAINAAQLAAALNVTGRTLQRRMKALSQETPKEFITRIRIELACTILASTDVSVRQTALQCGYSEDTAFRKAFHQVMAMTPAQYREWIAHRKAQVISTK
ncbi:MULTISPECIES: helix-turn-helix domain-containing protein [Pantoea]|uniref:GlxA family transcriptional regulator n=1 Tax=Pantoea TaxID=53335 RepID=UPI001F5295D0|nr:MULTISPECIES: helix-turn-helix domain-containing protein [Pantoea]MCI1028493.1 helix-turn-helix domain-containing protein [Pantoea dispersa]MDI6958313.1 helix-turn-helix domain-containing protein [Pantoea sp. Pa-EAmG]